jgi:transposase
MKCPRCKSSEKVKNGKIKGVQRYKCKKCHYNFTVTRKSTAKSNRIKRLAFILYLEGLGFRSIARVLKVSHVSVMKWIKKFGSQVEEVKNDEPVEVVEIDEMHTYVRQKKTINGYGLLLIEKGGNTLISLLGQEGQKQGSSYGKK